MLKNPEDTTFSGLFLFPEFDILSLILMDFDRI